MTDTQKLAPCPSPIHQTRGELRVNESALRPGEPTRGNDVWYRGWEIGWNEMSAKWAGAGWDAYKGGCDLGAPRITATGFSDCLDEIDDYEDGEGEHR